MSSDRYGRSFVQELLDDGDEQQALEAAQAALLERPEHAAAHFDLAKVYEALGEPSPALDAMERAVQHNAQQRSVEAFVLDDAYFSALLELAEQQAPTLAVQTLARYRERMPLGAHLTEVGEWQARLTGRAPSLLDKTKD